nr:integrase core domain-containing protein [Halomonas sp. NyZ770]
MKLVIEEPSALIVHARICGGPGRAIARSTRLSPRTNGKAERFIQTVLREWAYARSYGSSEERGRHLPAWLHQYNWHRPHARLDYHPPVSRLGLSVNNLMGLHS